MSAVSTFCFSCTGHELLHMDHLFVVCSCALLSQAMCQFMVGNNHRSHEFLLSVNAMALYLHYARTEYHDLLIFLQTGPQHQADRFGSIQISPIELYFYRSSQGTEGDSTAAKFQDLTLCLSKMILFIIQGNWTVLGGIKQSSVKKGAVNFSNS